MRILRISQNLYPEQPGGASYHVHALSRDQAVMGHDVTVVTVSDDESLPRRENRDGYEIVRARPNCEVIGNAFTWVVWEKLRSVDEYDIVHAHTHYYFSTLFAAIRRQISDTPLRSRIMVCTHKARQNGCSVVRADLSDGHSIGST